MRRRPGDMRSTWSCSNAMATVAPGNEDRGSQMKGHGEKRTRKEEAFIAALLTAPSIEQAAKQAGIGTVTAWRGMQQPAFKSAYRAARRAGVAHAIAFLQH